MEEERYKKMITSPEMFEKFLPYAMAFGVEEKWANAFEDIYREPPQWYVGGTGPFNVVELLAQHRHHVERGGEQHVVESELVGLGRRWIEWWRERRRRRQRVLAFRP